MPLAATLDETLDVLDILPLEFTGAGKGNVESNPRFYASSPRPATKRATACRASGPPTDSGICSSVTGKP